MAIWKFKKGICVKNTNGIFEFIEERDYKEDVMSTSIKGTWHQFPLDKKGNLDIENIKSFQDQIFTATEIEIPDKDEIEKAKIRISQAHKKYILKDSKIKWG